jgi:hypothetical protein
VPEDAFTIKDSGARQEFAGGMVRDTTEGKINYLSTRFGPMYRRWAAHLTKGRAKYPDPEPGVPNWTLAAGPEELNRARESALRHFEAWLDGELDEDHAAAVFFNVNLAEYVLSKTTRDCEAVTPPKDYAESPESFLMSVLHPTYPHPPEYVWDDTLGESFEPVDTFGFDFVDADSGSPRCDNQGDSGWYCDRPRGHTGDHGWPGAGPSTAGETRWPNDG